MPTNKYIVLANSTGSLSKRFSVIQMSTPMRRMDTVQYTVGGKLDKHAGPVLHEWNYALWIPIDTPPTSDYGTWANFETLFNLANANASPSDVITLTDHFQQSHYVYFAGEAVPTPLTTILTGQAAWYIVPVVLLEKT